MRDAGLYTALVLLSLVEVFAGCAAEVVRGNIIHIKHGDKPNASCALLPLIPVLQIAYVSVAMGLNYLAPYLGYGVVGGLSAIITCRHFWRYRKARRQLEMLLSSQPDAT